MRGARSARALVAFLVVAVALPLAALQGIAALALAGDARAGAWPRVAPRSLVARVDAIDASAPLPATLRLLLARRAFARGDVARAARFAATLPPSRDRFALEGRLADARGDDASAVRAYLAAGDLSGVERHVAALLARHREPDAVALQRDVVARLTAERTQADTLAQADFELGRVDEAASWRLLVGSPERRALEDAAVEAYARAVALAPYDVRFLIALGNQELDVDDLAAADRAFERARDVDPTSAEPLAGLGDAAFSRDDAASARAYLARARALDAASSAVRNLARELGD